jgi:hypothetical protein
MSGGLGLSAGGQPARGSLVAERGLSAPTGGELEDERVERLRNDGLLAVERWALGRGTMALGRPEPDLLGTGVSMAEGGAADRGGPLSAEKKEQADGSQGGGGSTTGG